jgi:hypothetical protein
VRLRPIVLFIRTNPISFVQCKQLEKRMNPRFDVFRKETEHFIRWIGIAVALEEVEKLIRTDSGNTSDDHYVVVHSAYGGNQPLMHSNGGNCSQQKSIRRPRVPTGLR